MNDSLHIVDTGRGAENFLMPYRAAWDLQLKFHDEVLAGTYPAGVLMLVEHPPVITIGRRPDAQKHLLVSPKLLESRGVELIETDRGGDITFHGPGQLVVYPILNLNYYNLNLHNYMRLLETVTIDTLKTHGLAAFRVEACTGVWINPENALIEPPCNPPPHVVPPSGGPLVPGVPLPNVQQSPTCTTSPSRAKITAIGIKLRRWTTLHGLALNVTTDLSYFTLINACGLSKPVTSMQQILQEKTPTMSAVKQTLTDSFRTHLAALKCHRKTDPAA